MQKRFFEIRLHSPFRNYNRGFHTQKPPSLKTVQQSHRYSKPFATPFKDGQHAIEKRKYELQWC